MDTLLTVVIPYTTEHAELVPRAVASVQGQTIPCEYVTVYDKHRQGVAHARNEGVKQVKTPLIAFLDADDYLYPDYAEKMLTALKPDTYTYCNFHYGSQKAVYTVDKCIDTLTGRRHTVSCVMKKDDFWAIGGFDTSFLKAEDVEFYQRAHHKGYCGIHVDHILFHYTDDKPIKRHQLAEQTPAYIQKIRAMYQGVTTMGCCGDFKPNPNSIPESHLATDVLVTANWSGNRKRTGAISKRSYRGGNGKFMWVDPRDQQAQPNLFKLVVNKDVEIPAPTLTIEPTDFDSLSRQELMSLAKERGAAINIRMSKTDLIAILEAHHESTT